jgi:hypothetical protein
MENQLFAFVQSSGLLECIDDAYIERGDWMPLVMAFADAVQSAERESMRKDAERLRAALRLYIAAGYGNSTDHHKQGDAYDAAVEALGHAIDAAMAQPAKVE